MPVVTVKVVNLSETTV